MSAEKKDIVVFGSIVHDLVSYTERFPRPGESVRGTAFQNSSGGKGANQATAASLLGAKVGIIARVGNDIFGPINKSNLTKSGVDTQHIETSENLSTGTATITVSADGENSIVVTLGANTEVSAARAEELKSYISGHKLILCQNEIDQEANLRAFQVAKRNGVMTFYNSAPGYSNIDKTILKFTDILCTNENETEFITGKTITTDEEFKAAALGLLDEGPEIVIVTLGPKGALVAFSKDGKNKKEVKTIQIAKVKAVDTTGAGDCFCGSLAYFLTNSALSHVPLEEKVRRSAEIAAVSVQFPGTQISYSPKEKLDKKLFV